MEAALESAKNRLQAVLDAALDCIICMDVKGHIQEFNTAAESTFGYTRAEAVGRDLAEVIVPPELREQHRMGLARYLKTGVGPVIGKRLEIPSMKKGGQRILVELAITEIPTEAGPFFTAYLRDITLRRRDEQRREVLYALAELLAKSKRVQDVAAKMLEILAPLNKWSFGALWITTEEGLDLVDTWDREPERHVSFERASRDARFGPGQGLPGRVLANKVAAWVEDVVIDTNFPRSPAAAASGLHSGFAFPICAHDGMLGVIEFFGNEPQSPDKDLLSMASALGRQVGQWWERQLAVEEMERQKHAAERANAAKDQFIAMLSHELRTPLSPVLFWADMTAQDPELPPKLREGAAMVLRSVKTEVRMIDELLDATKFRHGKVDLERDSCDLNVLATDSLRQLQEHLESKQMRTETALEPALPPVICDEGRIRQVMVNLIRNAIKFTAPGGLIRVRTALAEGGVCFSVEDTGSGMAPGRIDRLFEPFEQGVHQKSGGLGLGLTIVKSIVDLHGGRIEATSEGEGKGSTFTVWLPRRET
ncbi:MAG: ATP-binding protein [Roseimicrobium sp.]